MEEISLKPAGMVSPYNNDLPSRTGCFTIGAQTGANVACSPPPFQIRRGALISIIRKGTCSTSCPHASILRTLMLHLPQRLTSQAFQHGKLKDHSTCRVEGGVDGNIASICMDVRCALKRAPRIPLPHGTQCERLTSHLSVVISPCVHVSSMLFSLSVPSSSY